MTLQQVFATNFRILLAERNLKITNASNATGLSRTTLTAIAQGRQTMVKFETIEKLAKYLNVESAEFFKHKEGE